MEIARLTAVIAERQGAITYAAQENQRLRTERDAARQEVAALSKDLGSLRAKEKFSLAEKERLEEKISELEETVKRQSRTIRVQSDQIAAPKVPNRTPVRGSSNIPTALEIRQQFHQQPTPVYNSQHVLPASIQPSVNPAAGLENRHKLHQQPAPVYSSHPFQTISSQSASNLITSQENRQRHHPQFAPNSVHRSHPSQATNVQPVSTPAVGLEDRQQIQQQPASAYNSQHVQAINLQTSTANRNPSHTLATSGSLVVQSEDTSRINWTEEFADFFDLTLTFSRNFGNVPNDGRDSALNGRLLSQLQQQYQPTVVQDLLSSSDTRYFLVTTVINRAICEDVFRSSLVKGYSSESDNKLGQIRRSILPDLVVSMKRGLVKAAADILNEMKNAADFQQWVEHQVNMKASIIWDRIKTLLAPGVERQDAFDDLVHVFRQAYRVGLMMYSAPVTWKIDFPANARDSFFDPTTMINKDVQFPENPVRLRERRLRVRLAMTPVVVGVNYMDEAIMPRTVHFAQVLLQT